MRSFLSSEYFESGETDAYEVRVYTRSNNGGDDGVPFEYYWGVTTTYCADSEEWPD